MLDFNYPKVQLLGYLKKTTYVFNNIL